jgi:hypothetical protein
MDRTMAVIKLRLFSSMSLSLLAAGWRGQVAEPLQSCLKVFSAV